MIGLAVDNYRNCVVTYCSMSVRSDVSSQASAFARLYGGPYEPSRMTLVSITDFATVNGRVLRMVLKENNSL